MITKISSSTFFVGLGTTKKNSIKAHEKSVRKTTQQMRTRKRCWVSKILSDFTKKNSRSHLDIKSRRKIPFA